MSASCAFAPVLWPVHPVWQLDPRHPIPAAERRTCCAVATTLMLARHFRPELRDALTFRHVHERLLADGGRDASGHWRHAAQVRFLVSVGLIAWRRNWDAPRQDFQWLAVHERYSPAQLAAARAQADGENAVPAADRPWHSLRAALLATGPVIVSVAPGFTTNRQNHQILLHGLRAKDATEILAFVDPLADPDQPDSPRETDRERFLAHFNRRAIHARPPAAETPAR